MNDDVLTFGCGGGMVCGGDRCWPRKDIFALLWAPIGLPPSPLNCDDDVDDDDDDAPAILLLVLVCTRRPSLMGI
jgi:hypothetical protein